MSFIFHIIFLNFSFPLSKSIYEFSFIADSCRPLIDTLSMRFSLFELTLKIISIWEILFSLSLFEKIKKKSLIFLSTFTQMNAIPLYFSFNPMTHINIPFFRFPYPSTMLFIFVPFSRIIFSIVPIKLSNFRTLSVDEFSFVYSFCCDLYSLYFL